MHNPIMVELVLDSEVDENGKSVYSPEEIEAILIKNFGPEWEDDWYQKRYGKKKKELFRL